MRLLTSTIVMFSTVVLINTTVPVFAESAPVYDVDAMQQSFDSDTDQGQDLPPPPPPPPSQEGGFISSGSSTAGTAASPSPSMSLSQRIRRIEQQISNMQTSEGTAHIESLQEEIKALRSQIEELTHQLQQVQTQQKALSADLDKRLATPVVTKPTSKKITAGATDASLSDANTDEAVIAKSTATASKSNAKIAAAKQSVKTTAGADTVSTEAVVKKSSDGQPNVAEEQQIYQTAYNYIKAKKYSEAVNALQGMLKKYPSGQFASNAHYWLGELYGLMGKNDLALTEFDTVVVNYPDSPRVSDAQLKVGLIYAALAKWSDAKVSFKKVINHFPGTASARVAGEQLKQIKIAGH
jgi:tol-pal system protein YbgF